MKVLLLNGKEQKELTRFLHNQVRYGRNTPYYLTTILEKLSISEYERAFDIMNVEKFGSEEYRVNREKWLNENVGIY